ncbi:MAG TPA: TIGR03435 family protein [Verrucomicrobiae bacterium]|nr:TIGR03435 family protein [Verrucomicrobiae bacterium]
MKHSRIAALAAVCLSTAAPGQEATPPRFLNADVHASLPGGRDQAMGRFSPGARYEALGFTMLDLIVRAYGVRDRDWVLGGPPWLGIDKFDIIAEVPANARPAAARPMLQALLAERFSLAVHNDSRPMPVYVLAAGKHPALKNSAGGASQCTTSGRDVTTMVCTNIGMEQFARELHDAAYDYFDRPLIDKTGLTGGFDFALHWTPLNQIGTRTPDGQSNDTRAFDAVEKQLGLKVELRNEPVPVLIVDRVNRTPTPNAPGVAAALKAAALTEFEVAEVRAHKPETPFKYATYDTEVDILGLSLRNLISEAYGIRGEQLASDAKWIDTDAFDVIAKAPRRVPWENMQVMLQNLIEQRFKLTCHEETRPIAAYVLTVRKRTAQLADADPSRHSDCRRSAAAGGVSYSCRNTSMAQFAERFRETIWSDVENERLPVADATGLTGAFDFTVTWRPRARPNPAGPGHGDGSQAGGIPEASTPTGEISLFEAIDKQLGIRLQKEKHPMPVMVIDHVEHPAEN